MRTFADLYNPTWGELAARTRFERNSHFPFYESDSAKKVRELREQLERIAQAELDASSKEWNEHEAVRLRREIRKKGHVPAV